MNGYIENSKVEDLKRFCREDEAAASVFAWASNRANDSAETSIDRLIRTADIERRQAIAVARELEDIGVAKFVTGRRGAKSRIEWLYSLKSIGKAAKGAIDVLEELDPDVLEDAREEQTVGIIESEHQFMPLTIAKAKEYLAESVGVPPENIEITIKG